PVIGFEGMLQHYKITSAQWTIIAGHWNSVIPTNPQYVQYGMLAQQESERIRAGGQPKPVRIGSAGAASSPGQPAAAPAPQPAPGMMPNLGAPAAAPGYAMQPNPYAQPHAQPNPYANPYAQQGYNAQAQSAGAQLGGALNAFGNAFGSFV